MIVVADSSPLRYLILIDRIDLLPTLFGSIIVPPAVVAELTHSLTPVRVQAWMRSLPSWARVQSPKTQLRDLPETLGKGEREAIALAQELRADALLADDEQARQESLRRNIPVQGTLGILNLAAEHGLVDDLAEALRRLKRTNFRISEELFEYSLELEAKRKAEKRGPG